MRSIFDIEAQRFRARLAERNHVKQSSSRTRDARAGLRNLLVRPPRDAWRDRIPVVDARRRHRLWVLPVGLALLAVTGCGSRELAPREAACAARDELSKPSKTAFFEWEHAQFVDSVEYKRELLETMGAGAPERLREQALDLAALEYSLGQRIAAEWGGGTGEALKRKATEAGFSRIEQFVVGEDTIAGRGGRYPLPRLLDLRHSVASQMSVLCGKLTPLESTPHADAPPPGVVVYTDLRTGDLARMSTSGERLPPARSEPAWHTNAEASGDRLAFLADNDVDGPALLFTSKADGSQAKPFPGPQSPGCFSWAPDGARLVTTTYRPERQLQVLEINGRGAEVPFPNAGCAAIADDSTLLVERGEPDSGWASIWRVEVDGTNAEEAFSLPGCDLVHPRVAAGRVAMVASCREPADSGIYVADVEGGSLTQVIAGVVGVFSWAPDGDWLCFVYLSPGDDSDHVAIWISKANGSTPRHLVARASFPAWTASASP